MNTSIVNKLVGSYFGSHSLLRAITLIVVGTVLLTISAKVQVPFYPVPMTLQTLAILLICTIWGMPLGILTVALYLVEGALGLPVFAGTPQQGIGIAYMIGPTGGYLVGFLAAAVLLGYGARFGWDKKLLPCFVLMCAAILVIYLLGYLWLGSLIGYDRAFWAGIAPFVLGDLVKSLLAVVSLRLLHQYLESSSSKN